MGRSRPTVFIPCEKSRSRTFSNRMKGLMKKSRELSVLCGVDVCIISLGPETDQKFEPKTWPSEPSEVARILSRYEGGSKKEKDTRRRVDLSSFLEESTKKLKTELGELRKANLEISLPSWDQCLDHHTEETLRDLAVKVDSKIEAVKELIRLQKGKQCVVERDVECGHNQFSNMLELSGRKMEMCEDQNYLISDQFLQMGPDFLPPLAFDAKPLNRFPGGTEFSHCWTGFETSPTANFSNMGMNSYDSNLFLADGIGSYFDRGSAMSQSRDITDITAFNRNGVNDVGYPYLNSNDQLAPPFGHCWATAGQDLLPPQRATVLPEVNRFLFEEVMPYQMVGFPPQMIQPCEGLLSSKYF